MKMSFKIVASLFLLAQSGCDKFKTLSGTGDYHTRIHYSESSRFWWRSFYPGHLRSSVTLKSLHIDGITYKYLVGPEPAYIDVPNRDAIIFVTDEYDSVTEKFHGRTLNYYDFKTKHHVQFEPRGALSGSCNAIVPRKGLGPNVLIESFDGQLLVLVEKGALGWMRMFFDLKSERYTRMQFMLFDDQHASTNYLQPAFLSTNDVSY